MKLILLYIVFLVFGVIGNYFANRNKPANERKKWWLKLFTYIIWITAVIAGTSFTNWFFSTMVLSVILMGFIEILKPMQLKSLKNWLILFVYGFLAFGYSAYSFIDTGEDSEFFTFVFILVCICDAFSQITGQLFGKTKILKRISPGKTLEGLIGGISITLFTSLYLIKDEFSFNYFDSWIIFGVLIAIGAPLGDLLGSVLKRHLGIKDFGTYFPGHGGILDRYDSHIFTGFLFYIIFELMNH